ncbi:MAG: PCP reductase family protein, partial [bacterium]
LDVKLGGRKEAAQPMEMVQKSLAYQQDGAMPSHVHEHGEKPDQPAGESSGSKCPFTGMANEAHTHTSEIVWTNEAEERLARIPDFVRPMVKKSIEQHARDNGYSEINATVMEEVKGNLGMMG